MSPNLWQGGRVVKAADLRYQSEVSADHQISWVRTPPLSFCFLAFSHSTQVFHLHFAYSFTLPILFGYMYYHEITIN